MNTKLLAVNTNLLTARRILVTACAILVTVGQNYSMVFVDLSAPLSYLRTIRQIGADKEFARKVSAHMLATRYRPRSLSLLDCCAGRGARVDPALRRYRSNRAAYL